MAWFLKKAIRVGPLLRFNLSKSGIGCSFGVTGARIGVGPRGPYLAGGRHGIYFRQSLRPYLQHSQVTAPTPDVLHCTRCGTVASAGNDFCTACGAHFVASGTMLPVNDHYVNWFLFGALILVIPFVFFLIRLPGYVPARSPSPAAEAPAPSNPKPDVPFSVKPNAAGKPVAVWLLPEVSNFQVRELLRYFRIEIQDQKFADLGINAPTSAKPGAKPNFSAGTIFFYRAPHTSQAPNSKRGVRMAEYKWGLDGNAQKDFGAQWIDSNHLERVF